MVDSIAEVENLIFVVIGAVPFLGRYAFKVLRVASTLQIPLRKAMRGASSAFEQVRAVMEDDPTASELETLREQYNEVKHELDKTKHELSQFEGKLMLDDVEGVE